MVARGGAARLVSFLSIGLTVAITLAWISLMVSEGDWMRRTTPLYTLDVGLYSVRIAPGIAGMAATAIYNEWGGDVVLSTKIQHELGEFIGEYHGLYDISQIMCNIKPDFCDIWSSLRTSSWVVISISSLAIVLQLTGAGLVYYYWTRRPEKSIRRCYTILLGVAPMLYILNILQYVTISRGLENMPPKNQTGLWGHSLIWSVVASMAAFLPFVACNLKDPTEELFAAREHLQEAEADAAVEMAIMSGNARVLAESITSTGLLAKPSLVAPGQSWSAMTLPHSGHSPGGHWPSSASSCSTASSVSSFHTKQWTDMDPATPATPIPEAPNNAYL